MQVILKQDVKGSGKAGDLVKVSDGYARNFLFPKGLAVPASAAAVNEKATRDAAAAHHKQEELDAAKALAAQLEGKSVELKARAGANGKIFGSVTSKEIAQELKQRHGIELEKKKIVLESEIKAFGTYTFEAKLHPGVSAKMSVKVTEE